MRKQWVARHVASQIEVTSPVRSNDLKARLQPPPPDLTMSIGHNVGFQAPVSTR